MSGLIFHLIAHTHWDREWYLPQAAFQARLVPMLDDLIERLQADAGFRSFLLDGQTVLLEDYLRARPEREPDLKALVKTSRLQVGPWYVLPDELIPSGESVVRNGRRGAAAAARLGGRLDVLYSPDAFGHPAVWPTLAREFGIKYGVLWRGLGGERGQERDLYHWRGPDGHDVLVWHLPPDGYEIGAALPADADRLPAAWHRVRTTLVERAAGKHIPVFVGADHHAAHPQLVRLRDLLLELEPANAFRISRLDEFLQAAAEGGSAAAAPLTPGELRWSYRYTWTLQGVHGTRAPLKRRHGEAELWLERVAEPLAALARRYGGRERRPLLDLAWRTLVRAQFHDTIAGCTSDEVAAAAERRVGDVRSYAREIARGALHDLVGHDPDAARDRGPIEPALVLWNPGARPRAGIVVADVTFFRRDVLVGPPPPGDRVPRSARGYEPFALKTRDGRTLPVQVLARRVTTERLEAPRHYPDEDEVDQVRVAFRSPAVPGLGLGTLTLGPAAPLPRGEGVQVRGRALENRFVEVGLESSGALTLVDRRSGERYSGLLRLEDAGDAGDAYTYCPPVRDRLTRSRGPITVRRLAAGPLVAGLEARWPVLRDVAARLVIQLYADSPLVRCTLDIENRAPNHRLRARLPLGTRLAEATAVAGAAFGAAARPAVIADPADYPRETPVRTAPAHRFVAAARAARGLALLAPGFFEYEWTPAGELIVTVLRCVGDLSRGDLPTRPGHAGWPTPTPEAQCLGRTRIDWALAPLSATDLERGELVPHLWEDAFLPLQGWWLRDAGTLTPAPADVTLDGTGLVLSAVKPAQAGSPMVLRCYNATGRKAAGAWRFGDGVKSAHRVRADERESVALVLEQRGRAVRFVAEPHEIVTILVT
jgi:alpha-mannosidase